MMKFQVIPASGQAHQVLRESAHPEKEQKEATIHAGTFGYLSWAYVTEDVYYPTHRNGAMDCYIYLITQGHLTGDHIANFPHVHEGDMIIMQSGPTNAPFVKRIATEFSAFEFWFKEEGVLRGTEQPDYMKINAIQFPMKIINDVVERRLFGEGAPISHINGLTITELILPPGTEYLYNLYADRKLGIYIVKGEGNIGKHVYIKGDFAELLQDDEPVDVVIIRGGGLKASRLILMDIKV